MTHWGGGEWAFDDECDCPYCSDWRDMHCPKCGSAWAWDGETEESRLCGSCQADRAELYLDDFPGHSGGFPF